MAQEILLVLGHRLARDDQPTNILRTRVHAAFAMFEEAAYREYLNPGRSLPAYSAIVLCGGRPKSSQRISEAAVMRMMLTRLMGMAIDSSSGGDPRILCEEQSFNTLQSLINATELLMSEYPGQMLNIEVVTHAWHSPRVMNYWRWSEGLKEARKRCSMSVARALTTPGLNSLHIVAQAMANWEAFFDPNRVFPKILHRRAA